MEEKSTEDAGLPSPESLVQEIGQGKSKAEGLLVSRYWRSLYFILQRRTNDADLAADIAQDTFIVVIRKARDGAITNPSAIAAFIRQTGINLLIAHYRKEKRRNTEADSDIVLDAADSSPGLLQSVASEKVFELVVQVLEELKVERDREILKAYFLHEEEKARICERLELSNEHFDRVLHRARGRLKQLLEFKYGKIRLAGDEENIAGTLLLILFLIEAGHIPAVQQYFSKIQTTVREAHSSRHYEDRNEIYGRIFNSGGDSYTYPKKPVESELNG